MISLVRKIDVQIHNISCVIRSSSNTSLLFTLHHLKYTALSIYNSQKQI